MESTVTNKTFIKVEIEAWLIAEISKRAKRASDDIDVRMPFLYNGLNSKQLLSLTRELGIWLGRSLPSTLCFDYPNIAAIASYLSGEGVIQPALDTILCKQEDQTLSEQSYFREKGCPDSIPIRPNFISSEQAQNLSMRQMREPIAIIGIGCRFPGGCNDPETFWNFLRDGGNGITKVPTYRWDVDALYDPNPDAPGKMYTRWGGFLNDVERFDASFFGISPREAVAMDPQQRLVMEVGWEALENAGQAPDKLAGSRTGVFIGISGSDYGRLMFQDSASLSLYSGTGSSSSIAAHRVSYFLGLRGPSIAVDTACSSSLVSVHLACQSLRNRECNLALGGGVNLILSPEMNIIFSKARLMARDGHCKTFDAAADGYVRSEGCGIVVLKRYSDAVRDGDNILALLLSTAVNQDGHSNGLTVPNGLAQQAVIREALANAQIEPYQVSYVETHGTGTSVGDPIEVQSLGAVLGENREKSEPLIIGSVKTNIGHLEQAAGIAGLIKVVLSLQHKEIPKHLHFKKINPLISLQEIPATIPIKKMPWPPGKRQRIAGVSGFSFGGTNVHALLMEAPDLPWTDNNMDRPLHIITLSTHSKSALKELADRYVTFLETHPEALLSNVCFTANTGRSHFPYRLAIAAESTKQLHEKMAAFRARTRTTGLASGQVRKGSHQKIAFLFTGQGSQYIGMGQQLYYTQPTFRKTLDRCAEILKSHIDRPLLSVVFENEGDASLLNQTSYTQPALFALEYALAEMWRSWGIKPSIVMGHSVGEYVAACVAGVFNLEDGLKLIAARSRLIQSLPQKGEMAAVFMREEQVASVVAPYTNVSIGAFNGPEHIVITGDRKSIKKIVDELASKEVNVFKLGVSHAFHSPLMEPILSPFEEIAKEVEYSAPRVEYVSNVTGRLVTNSEICEASYWRRHVRSPVKFATGVKAIHDQGYRLLVEIGPNPVLVEMGRMCLPEGSAKWLPSLRRGQGAWKTLLESIGELYTHGINVNWTGFDQDYSRRRIPLPTYPFERKRYWIKGSTGMQGNKAPLQLSSQVWESVVKAGKANTSQEIHGLGLDEYSKNERSLKRLCAAYVGLALRELGAFCNSKERHSVDTLIRKYTILPHFRQMLFRLLEALSMEGYLKKHEKGYYDLYTVQEASIDELLEEVRKRCTDKPQIIDFVQRCGEKMESLLLGKKDPLEMIFPKGSMDIAEGFYQKSPIACYYNYIAREILRVIVKKLPTENHLRVLEIGAGTGGTTAWLVPVLPPNRTFYTFTDVSSIFLNHAQKKFSDYSFIRYDLMNIEHNPVAQGFNSNAFDIIVAANVLHATRDLNETLEHCRSLLANGGMLLLWEITKPQLWFDITYGFILQQLKDENLRGGHPFLSPEKWKEVLGDHGFTEVVAFPKAGSKEEIIGQHIIVARASSLSEKSGFYAFTDTTKAGPSDRLPEALAFSKNQSTALEVHPLLEERRKVALPTFESRLNTTSLPFLKDHRLYGIIVLPGAAYLEMAIAASMDIFGKGYHVLNNVTFHEFLALPNEDSSIAIQLIFGMEEEGKAPFQIYSFKEGRGKDSWILHATGNVFNTVRDVITSKKYVSIDKVRSQCKKVVNIKEYYYDLANRGLYYGHNFQGIKGLWIGDKEAIGEIKLPQPLMPEGKRYNFHPVLLDACFQVLSAAILPDESYDFCVPTAADSIQIFSSFGNEFWCHAFLNSENNVEKERFSGGIRLIDNAGEVIAVISGFCLKPTKRITQTALKPAIKENLDDWIYEVEWQPKPTEQEKSLQGIQTDEKGDWVILADRSGVGKALSEHLKEKGETCIMVYSNNNNCKFSEENHFNIDPEISGSFECLLKELANRDFKEIPVKGVVHLWSLDHSVGKDKEDSTTINLLEDSQKTGCISVLHLIQALAKMGWPEQPRLWLVTRGGQAIGKKKFPAEVSHAPLWGLGKVIALEHPELKCVRVDLDPNVMRDKTKSLVEELWATDHEDEIAFRDNMRFVRRLVHSTTVSGTLPVSTANFNADNTYLITGGLGGLGLKVAKWMVERGARHLSLISRRSPTDEAMNVIKDLKDSKVEVLIANADVSNYEQLKGVFDTIGKSMPTLRGVFHLAGVLSDGVLLQQDTERFTRVLDPKVQGGWNLHLLTKNISLDFFVLFSSMFSILGSTAQGNHAAANSFLDILAYYRWAQGLPGISINWGAWSEVGAAAERNVGDRLAMRGMNTISPLQGLKILERVLQNEFATQLAVIPVDWAEFIKGFPIGFKPRFLAELVEDDRIFQDAVRTSDERKNLMHRLAKASLNEKKNILEDYILKEAGKIMGLTGSISIDVQIPLKEAGFDSLMAIELRDALGNFMGKTLPATLLFSYPTVQSIALYMVQEMFNDLTVASVEKPQQKDEKLEKIVAEIEKMSDEEVDDLLKNDF